MADRKRFEGTVNLDIRDSVADWTPYTQPMPPDGAPNVLLIMWDDTGFASWESYGGLVKMPNMDRISNRGLRYTQFHTTALCSPTRASTLTGRNHTTVGMAGISMGGFVAYRARVVEPRLSLLLPILSSPVWPVLPVPAIVVMIPAGVTLRTRLLLVSAM